MTFKIRIGNICKVSNNNVRICNRRLHIYFFVIPCNWMDRIGVWVFSVFHLNYLFKFRFAGLFGSILSYGRINCKNSHSSANCCGCSLPYEHRPFQTGDYLWRKIVTAPAAPERPASGSSRTRRWPASAPPPGGGRGRCGCCCPGGPCRRGRWLRHRS